MAEMGRPCEFNQDIADEICERLMNGESLRKICEPDTMPNRSTVFRWLAKANRAGIDECYVNFRDQYTRAKEEQADAIFDECLAIADDATNDYIERQGEDGTTAYRLNGEHVQRSKLRIDTRKWMAGKLRPKKYGDKLDVTQKNFNVTISGDDADL